MAQKTKLKVVERKTRMFTSVHEQRYPFPYKIDASHRQEMVTAIRYQTLSRREVHSSDFGRVVSRGTTLLYVLARRDNKELRTNQSKQLPKLRCLLSFK